MEKYIEAFTNSFLGTLQWTWKSVLFEVPWYTNYFWGLIVISLFVWGLEILFPWRKNQSIIRKDFWLDAFYMFFNFFLFAIGISGFYELLKVAFYDLGITSGSLALIDSSEWPMWLQLLVFFLVLDFVQWFTHILLHRFSFLWNFHKVHHSVKEMGFAAHLRYHWMENILYKPLKTFGVMILGGFEPEQAYHRTFLSHNNRTPQPRQYQTFLGTIEIHTKQSCNAFISSRPCITGGKVWCEFRYKPKPLGLYF